MPSFGTTASLLIVDGTSANNPTSVLGGNADGNLSVKIVNGFALAVG